MVNAGNEWEVGSLAWYVCCDFDPQLQCGQLKVYRVLSDPYAERDGDLRVIDGSGEDYLYPRIHFVLLNLPDNSVISH